MPGTGSEVAARQRPGQATGNATGSAHVRSNQTTAGSRSQPFSTPLR